VWVPVAGPQAALARNRPGVRTPVGTFLPQRGFARQAQSDRGVTLTCTNIGGRGRYRTADRWCVKPELYH
jgi:hypothetical protein